MTFKPAWITALLIISGMGVSLYYYAQGPRRQRPPKRKHKANQVKEWQAVPSTIKLSEKSEHQLKHGHDHIHIDANGIPEHKVGQFPNRGNPHRISLQDYKLKLTANPVALDKPIPLHNDTGIGPPNTPFGIAVNGVLFDPGTAEFWNGDRKLDWNYEALSGAVRLGVDSNNAHVQPNGAYHYHGLPHGLMTKLKIDKTSHSPLIGYAMDGYPIYALYGHKDPKNSKSEIIELKSSYKLKGGKRPMPPKGPGGIYDGTFSKDYIYVEGHGDLDECNGRYIVNKDFPKGIYAYFLTKDWPVIPRYFRAKPLKLRARRRP